jgi:hypothetical protein
MLQVSGMRTVTGVLLLAAGSSHMEAGYINVGLLAGTHWVHGMACAGRMSMAAINTRHSRGSFGFVMRPV